MDAILEEAARMVIEEDFQEQKEKATKSPHTVSPEFQMKMNRLFASSDAFTIHNQSDTANKDGPFLKQLDNKRKSHASSWSYRRYIAVVALLMLGVSGVALASDDIREGLRRLSIQFFSDNVTIESTPESTTEQEGADTASEEFHAYRWKEVPEGYQVVFEDKDEEFGYYIIDYEDEHGNFIHYMQNDATLYTTSITYDESKGYQRTIILNDNVEAYSISDGRTGAAALLLEKYPNADMEFIRQLFMASSNQESNGSDLGVLNIGEALTMGDGFQVQSAATKIKPQVPSVTTYDTSDIVSGSWGGTDHKNMISVLGSTTALKVAANAADLVDKYYHSDDSLRIKCKALHGVHNYVTNLHFLYEVAKNADNTAMGNKTSLTNYVKGINVPYSKDKTFGKEDLDILRQVIVDACTDPNGMGAKINADSKKTRRYMILGMAAHLLGDTFAHRTMVPVGASGGSSKDSKTFVKTHFKDWNDFSKRYTGLYIEFRDIKNYLKGTDNPYTDKSDFFPNRFTAAKTGVANLFKRYENENSFSVSKFYIETGFSKKLNNFNGYLESAGQGKVADEYSTANYRVDAPSGNISGNEKDYKDYNYSIYK